MCVCDIFYFIEVNYGICFCQYIFGKGISVGYICNVSGKDSVSDLIVFFDMLYRWVDIDNGIIVIGFNCDVVDVEWGIFDEEVV